MRRGGNVKLRERRPSSPHKIVSSADLLLHLEPQHAHAGVWFDSAGLGNHFSAGSEAPSVTPAWLDQQRALAFDGATTLLRCYGFRGLVATDEPTTFVICDCADDGSQNVPTLFYLSDSTAASVGVAANITFGSSRLQHIANLGSPVVPSSAEYTYVAPGAADGTPRLVQTVASNAVDRAELWLDGVLRGTANNGAAGGLSATPHYALLGANPFIQAGHLRTYFTGRVGEVFMFRSVPSAHDLQKILHVHVAQRWPTLYARIA